MIVSVSDHCLSFYFHLDPAWGTERYVIVTGYWYWDSHLYTRLSCITEMLNFSQ